MLSTKPSELESTPEKRLSFEEAKTLLKDQLDLEKELDKTVQQHQRWGLLEKFIILGFVKDETEYRQLLHQTTFNEKDLQKLATGLNQGGKVITILDPGNLDLSLVWETLIMEGCFAVSYPNYALTQITGISKIDPKDLYNLSGLDKRPREEQIEAFKSAYSTGAISEITTPRVLFTPDQAESTISPNSPTQEVQLIAENKLKALDPIADIMRFRSQVDAGLQKIAEKTGIDFNSLSRKEYAEFLYKCLHDDSLQAYFPDSKTITRYPLHTLPNGSILQLRFDQENKSVELSYGYPDSKNNGGSRKAFG